MSAPPDDVVSGILSAGEWPDVRPIKGIIETPTMRADGSILQAPGYDASTRLLYLPRDASFPAIPDNPTHEEARACLAVLSDVFADFPEEDASRMVDVAAILTLLARAAIDDCPAF